MNLEWKHFPLIVLGLAIGSSLGWLASFLIKPGLLRELEISVGLHGAGALFGGIAGLGITVVAIVARTPRDPKVGPAHHFTQFKGTGSILIGHSERRADGSYVATEWITVFWIPVFPVGRYRVTRHDEASTPISTPYTIHENLPVHLNDAARGYGITLLVLLGIIVFVLLLILLSIYLEKTHLEKPLASIGCQRFN